MIPPGGYFLGMAMHAQAVGGGQAVPALSAYAAKEDEDEQPTEVLLPLDTDFVALYEGNEYPFYLDGVSEGEKYFPDVDMVAPTLEIVGKIGSGDDTISEAFGSLLLRHKLNHDYYLSFKVLSHEYAPTRVTLTGYGTMALLEPLGAKKIP